MIIFIVVVQNSKLENLIFSKITVCEKLYIFIHPKDYIQTLQVIEIFKPDCFLIEKNLLTINGLDFANSLHAQPGMEQVPIIVFDAHCPLIVQEQKMSLPEEIILTIPHGEMLLETIDKLLLFPEQLLLTSLSKN